MKKYNADYYSRTLYDFRKQIGVILIIMLLFACKSALYIPSKSNIANNANVETLQKGRSLYVNNCSSCHTLYLPEKYTKAEWIKWINRMAPKSKISEKEKELIQAYVTKGE